MCANRLPFFMIGEQFGTMRRRVAVCLSVLMALVLLAEPMFVALHDHEDHQHHPNCQICQLATALASIDLSPGPQIEIEEVYHLLDVPRLAEDTSSPAIQRPRSRSPPQLVIAAT